MLDKIKSTISKYRLAYDKGISGFHGYIFRDAMTHIHRLYIASYEWKDLVKRVKERDNSTCRICLKPISSGICHHTSYDNWGKGDWGEEEDVIFVCIKCHNKEHQNGTRHNISTPFWAKRCADYEVRDEIMSNLYEHYI